MNEVTDYAALVAQAEKAVSGVKDPELKRIAFQKVLDELLAGGKPRHTEASSSKPRRHKQSRETTRAKAATGPKAYIQEMAEEQFFKKPKTIAEVKDALENRGHHIPTTSLSGPLQSLCQERVLRRQKMGGTGNRKTYSYSDY